MLSFKWVIAFQEFLENSDLKFDSNLWRNGCNGIMQSLLHALSDTYDVGYKFIHAWLHDMALQNPPNNLIRKTH